MSWRTVIIASRCKLDLKMGCMVIRGEETRRIFLDEIAVLLIENPAVSLTGCLLEALVEKKIRVIFCDSKRSPMAELAPYYGSHDSPGKIRVQAAWADAVKGAVWADIVSEKIRKQADFLSELGKDAESGLIRAYLSQIELRNDYEGHAGEVEKILDYMELVREFDRDKLFITVNMRAFFEDALMEAFLKTVLSHEFRLLMLEARAYPRLKQERRITIDADLCEF